MTLPVFYRSDQASIAVTVAGLTIDNVSWDVLEGGDNTVEGLSILLGGMAPQRALGGIPKRSPVTVKRTWSDTLINVYKELDALSGQAAVTVSYTVLSANKTAAFAPITYTGILGTTTRPNYAAATSEQAFLQIMVDTDGEIS